MQSNKCNEKQNLQFLVLRKTCTFPILFNVTVTKKIFSYSVPLIRKNGSHVPIIKSLHNPKHLTMQFSKVKWFDREQAYKQDKIL